MAGVILAVEPPEVEDFKTEAEERFFKIKRNGDNFAGFIIDRLKFIKCLQRLGFRRFDIDRSHSFIHIETGIVREVTLTEMIDAFFNYLKTNFDSLGTGVDIDMLISSMYTGIGNYFNEKLMYRLEVEKNMKFMKDGQHEKYLFYQNGFLRITKDGHKLLPYSGMNGNIWNNELLPRMFKKSVSGVGVFEKFCLKVCNNKPERLQALQSIIGYLMHTYFDTKLRAVLFTDSRISDDDEPNGRTGKTLLCKAIALMVNPEPLMRTFCELNGKDFDPANKYKYQDCCINTKIVALNDVRKNYNIENHFNDITEGLTVEQKNKNPFRIFAKLVFITNKTIKISGESAKDRVIEFEFSEYFHSKHSPYDEFKHWFFRDWDANEWGRFDLFIANSITLYLKHGIIESEKINLDTRKLNEETNRDFVEFMNDLKIYNGQRFDKKVLFESFITQYPDYNDRKFKQSRFTKWCILYTRYHPDFIEFKKTDEEKSGDIRYITFNKK